jgi:selenocysteine lyase/cysteine desulfurase
VTSDSKLAGLRELLPATGAGIYLATAERGPLPAETAAAMRDADEWELRVGRATEGRAEDMEQRIEEARAVLAALLVADPSEIVLTPGVAHAQQLAEQIAGPGNLAIVEHVVPNTGSLHAPLERVVAAGSDAAFVALDASLSAGTVPIDANALGVDFVIVAGDKWLLGPEETAALWIGPRATSRALVPSSSGLGRTAVLGLARSVGWLEMYVGLQWAFDRTSALTARLAKSLETDGVELLTPTDAMAAIVCFRLSAWSAEDALVELRRRVFAVIEPTPDRTAIRASVAWFNTEEEIDRFAASVLELARHTPDSLPRRPPLIVQ